MSFRKVKAKYISDRKTVFFQKGETYDVFIDDRYPRLVFFYYPAEVMDEEEYYGRARSLFEIPEATDRTKGTPMNNIYTRVSIRKYHPKPVEPDKLEAILRAAMQAPSAANQQPWEFYVVTNKEKLEALSKVSPYAGMTKDAPVAIVAVYRRDCKLPSYAQIDMSIAMQNLWLETDAQGLGGVWLGIAPIEERMQAVEQVLELPERVRAFAIFPLGYPAETRTQQDRFEKDRIHFVE